MLIYSNKRLVPTDVNMMVIRDKDNTGYFYIHRALYDQAVIIHDIYSKDFSVLLKQLVGDTTSRSDVDYFLENAPVPINALGPFLILIKEPLTDYIDMIGALHVMSGPIHLRNMLKVPIEMRNSIPSFSLSIKEEYQLAWDRFMQNAMEYSNDMFRMPTAQPMNGVQTTTVEQPVEEEVTGYEEYGIDQATLDFLMGDEDPFAFLDEPEDDAPESVETVVQESTPVASEVAPVTVAPVVEPVKEPEPTPEPVKLTGIDAVLNLV